jgi:GT2 family glycosyltransferase
VDRLDQHLSPGVTVVVPTWRRASWLEICLRALLGQSRPPEAIIVVARPKDAAALAVVDELGKTSPVSLTSLEVHEPGQIPAIVLGLSAVESAFAAFVDDDVEPDFHWLEQLLIPMTDPRVACVSGRVISGVGARAKVRRDSGLIRWYGKHVGNMAARVDPAPVEVESALDGNSIWRTDVLRSIEFESRLAAGDGTMHALDLALQVRERGFRVLYTSHARVVDHVAPRDPSFDRSDRPARYFSYSRQYTLIALRHFHRLQRAAFLFWWWGVGERGSYGLLTGMFDLVAQPSGTWPLVRSSFKGKWAGLRAYREAR